MRPRRLEGARAIVTGSSRGLGRSVAIAFAGEGGRVVINCDKSEKEAEEVVNLIRSGSGEAVSCLADVRSFDDCVRMVDLAVKEFGGVDILVNNAGITKDAMIQNIGDEDWSDVINVNLKGVLNCTRAVVPMLTSQQSGRIINISSVVGIMGNIGQSSYAAAKAGVIGLTKTHARELSRYGILVNAIAPGFCDTDMVKAIPEEVKQKLLRQIPLRRFGLPEEIAGIAVFLASDDATYVTGQVIGANGGLYM